MSFVGFTVMVSVYLRCGLVEIKPYHIHLQNVLLDVKEQQCNVYASVHAHRRSTAAFQVQHCGNEVIFLYVVRDNDVKPVRFGFSSSTSPNASKPFAKSRRSVSD